MSWFVSIFQRQVPPSDWLEGLGARSAASADIGAGGAAASLPSDLFFCCLLLFDLCSGFSAGRGRQTGAPARTENYISNQRKHSAPHRTAAAQTTSNIEQISGLMVGCCGGLE